MPIFLRKNPTEILRQALRKLEESTPVRAVGPGSVVRAFAEAITTELGDVYDALDFNMAQSVISTASGTALDLLGSLYNVPRKTLSTVATADKKVGSFYFYLNSPHNVDITIPIGTKVYTDVTTFVGRQFSYRVTEPATIRAGTTKVFASVVADFSDGSYTAGIDSLTVHDFVSPAGTQVRCTNPKPIAAVQGFEDDDNYRLRITKAIRVASAGTLEAVRFAALGVNGVRDVQVRQTPYGLGSYEVLVTSETANVGRTVAGEVLSALDSVRPLGVRLFLRQPSLVAVDIDISIFTQDRGPTSNSVLTGRAVMAARRYLNTLLPGQVLVYNRLIQAILDSSNLINDVQITRYAPNGVEVLRRNYTPEPNQQLVPGHIAATVPVV